MIFHRMSSIFLYKKAEVFFCLSFYPKELPFSQHRLSGGAQTAHAAVHPFRFSAPADRGGELPQAGSPLTGGKFFAEPQQRNSPSADGGGRGTRRGGKKEGQPAFFLPLALLPFPYSLVWRRLPTCDRFEKENGRGFLLPCLSLPIRSVRYRTATHTGYSTCMYIVRPRNGKPSRPCANEACAMTAAFSILNSPFQAK